MATSRSLRSTKKQTRLEFHPLSSPPTQSIYSPAIQDRLANVGYKGSKRRKTGAYTGDDDDDEQSLPTPQPTSPAEVHAEVARSSSPLSSLRTSPAVPPCFVDDDQDANSEDEDDIVLPSSKRKKLDPARDNKMGNTNSTQQPSRRGNTKSPPLTTAPFVVNNLISSTPTRRSSRLADRSDSTPLSDPATSSQRLASVDIPTCPRQQSNIGSAESSDDDVMVTKPAIRRTATKRNLKDEDQFVVDDDEVELIHSEDNITPRKTHRKRRHAPQDFIVGNDEIEYITSDEQSMTATSPSRSRKLARRHEPSSSIEKRSKKRLRREQAELAEDLLDLQDSEPEACTRTSRTRGGPVTTRRDKAKEHFELLKRRRAGERAPHTINSDEDEALEDDPDGVNIERVGHENNRFEIVSDDTASTNNDNENHDEPQYLDDEDDFVVDDTATTSRLGRPNTDIPLEFTSFASAKPRELFPHVIEWMVKNRISPAFNRHDDVYRLSFSRLDDQVKAQAGSRLISSAWNATFKYAILARPGIHITALPGLDEDLIRTCDACNKSNHPARYDFTLSGEAYYQESLEPVDDDDDDSGSPDDDNRDVLDNAISYDEQGHVLASQNMHFYLGRFCAANAEMGHKLTHWKYHLNEQVLSYLGEQGVLSAEAIINRESMNKKKREKMAEDIVDAMQETGMLADLWHAFKDDLEDARTGMEGHERKGGGGKGRSSRFVKG